MNNSMEMFSGWFGIAVILFLVILAVLWFLLPFMIYSIQKRSVEQVAISKLILTELEKLNQGVEEISEDQEVTPVAPESVKTKPADPSMQVCPDCGQKNAGSMKACTHCGFVFKK